MRIVESLFFNGRRGIRNQFLTGGIVAVLVILHRIE